MKPLPIFSRFLLPVLCGSLLSLTACKKDSEGTTPSKTAQLTAVTWRENSSSLVVNGVEGTQTTPAASADSYKFTTDGKLVVTEAGGAVTNGTWALANNDSQLTLTMNGQTQTQEIFALTPTSFSSGFSFTQAQVQTALAGQPVAGVPNGLITLLILSAGGYTFPAGTPTVNASQITSLQARINMVPK
jgi:hypothetical protein